MVLKVVKYQCFHEKTKHNTFHTVEIKKKKERKKSAKFYVKSILPKVEVQKWLFNNSRYSFSLSLAKVFQSQNSKPLECLINSFWISEFAKNWSHEKSECNVA